MTAKTLSTNLPLLLPTSHHRFPREPRPAKLLGAVLWMVVLPLLCAFNSVQAQTFGGATKIISGDYAPARSSIATDDFGDIYIAYDVLVSRTPTASGVISVHEIRVARSTDGGSTFTSKIVARGQTRLPSLAVSSAGTLFLSYLRGDTCSSAQDCLERPAAERAAIMVTSSSDGGETFLPAVQVSTPFVTTVDEESNIAVDASGKVYVVWSEAESTDGTAKGAYSPNIIRMRTSTDQARTFSPPILIRGDPGYNLGEQFISGNLTSAKIAVTWDGKVHITWLQCATDYCFELFYSRSMDGQAFSAALLVDDRVDIYSVGNQGIAVDFSGDVSVVYTRDDSGFDLRSNVYYSRIKDGVVTSRSNVSNVPSEFQAYQPAVAIDGFGRIYVAWTSTAPGAASRSEPNEILMRRSSDGGRSFSAVANISNSAGSAENPGAYSPTLAIGLANTPLIAWGDNQPFCSVNCFSYPGELRFRRGTAAVEVVDPNPRLIGTDGRVINNAGIAADISVSRAGAATDGVSKLLIVVRSSSTLRMNLEGTGDLDPGKLHALENPEETAALSTLVVPQLTGDNEPVAVAVYIPPISFGVNKQGQRSVDVRIQDASPDGGSVVVSLTLEPPPVVLVHGLWSRPEVWIDGGFLDALAAEKLRVFLVDYEIASAASFDPTLNNKPGILSVKNTVTDALANFRSRSIAATQADVVGHSMGGLMTRGFIQQPDYRQPKNFMKGAVHRLITIGTPHLGSPLGKLLFDHRNDSVTLPDGTVVALKDLTPLSLGAIDQGAIEAFIPGSSAYRHMEETKVAAHAIVTTWSPTASASAIAIQSALQIVARDTSLDLDELFGETDYDLIVGATSQYGHLPRSASSTTFFTNTIHATVLPAFGDMSQTDNPLIMQRVISLLKSADATQFADGFPLPVQNPPPSNILAARAGEALESAAAPTGLKAIKIVEPAEGASLDHFLGVSIKITAEIIGEASPQKLVFLVEGIGMFAAPATPPFTVDVPLPHDAPLGAMSIVALALDASGVLLGDSTQVVLTQNSNASALRLQPSEMVFAPGGPPQQLLASGRFFWPAAAAGVSADGWAWKDVSEGSHGATYLVRGGNHVVTVSSNGLVTPVNEGVDIVEVRYRDKVAFLPVMVVSGSAPPTTPTPTPGSGPSGRYSISGHVTGETGSPLGNVAITLQSGTETRTVQSDSTGSYSFGNLPGGAAYRVTASKFRYLFAPARQGFDTLTTNQTVDFTALQGNFRGAINGKIAFASTRDSIGNAINFEIYVGDPDGSNQTRLTDSLGQDLQPAWSPDGKKIAFSSQRDGNAEIYVMNADGSGVTRLTDDSSSDTTPAWSPDGRQIAFASSREGSGAIYVMDADGANVRRLTPNSDSDSSPTWSPDGTTLAFQSRRDGDTEIYTINTDGSSLAKLTDNEAREQQPSWSPNGAKIVFSSNRDGNNEIYVMDADGANPVRLTDHRGLDWYPGWSPDGTKIIFDSTRDGANDIYTVSPAGGSVTRLTDQPPYNTNADWQALAPPPPTILSFSPQSALPGSTVTIFGANLTEALAVQFNGVTSRFAFDSTELIATIPLGATTGPITVASATGTNTTAGNFIVLLDADNDGMSDGFEQQHFGGAQAGNPAEDSDGDGATNLQEYRAGTNPADSQSVFRITDVRREGNEIIVVFPGLTSKRYELEASADLADGFHDLVTKTAQMTADTLVELRVPRNSSQPFLFFRVVTMP